MKKVVTKKPSAAPAAGQPKTADAEASSEEPEPTVLCLRIIGSAKISIYIAMDKYDGTHPTCVSECDHRCIHGGKKKNSRKD